MIRTMAVAGMFYPRNKFQLDAMITKYLNQVFFNKEIKTLKLVLVPHAGYIYSGQTAAYSYKIISQLPKDKKYTVILIGPAHRAYIHASIGNYTEYETPFGNIHVNKDIVSEIIKKNNFDFIPEAHKEEHCLEVQMPFLIKTLSKFNIVTILCGSISSDEMVKVLDPYFKMDDIIFVISSDLSHFLSYNEAVSVDKRSIDIFLKGDLYNENQIDACGKTAIITCMKLSNKFGLKTELLDYRNSGDTSGRKDSVVGYASAVIY